MIRPEQLEELRQQIAKDEQLVADLRLKRFVGAGEAYSAAKGRIALAQDVLADLTAQHEAEQAVIANRPNVEKAEAKYLDGAARTLGKADDRVRAALEAAQSALRDLVDATNDRRTLMDVTAQEMGARGLTLRDGDGASVHETGTEQQLNGSVVRIRSKWWTQLAPLDLVDWVQHRVIAARMPDARMPHCFTCKGVGDRTDGITEGVAEVPAVSTPKLPPARPGPVMMGAPVYINSVSDHERKIDEQELQWTSMPVKGDDGETVWRRVPPTDAMKERAAQRKQLLHDGVASGNIIASQR